MKTTHTFQINFFPRKIKNNPLLAWVYARITINGSRLEFSLKRKIEIHNWDLKKGKLKKHTSNLVQINQYLEQVRTEIFTAYEELRREGKVISAHSIKSRYFGEDEIKKSLLELITFHYDTSLKLLSPGTLKMYRSTKNYLLFFLKKELKCQDIYLSQLNYAFITKLELFLRTNKLERANCQMQHNNVMKHLQRFRTIINLGVKLEWLQKDPFTSFKFTYKKSERSYLPQDELTKLETSRMPTKRLEFVKDIFVFSCYTGLAYIDVMNLSEENLSKGIDGGKWIFTYREKTEVSVKIPILEQAQVLIDKYKKDPRSINRGHIFPSLSNQKTNQYLSLIHI